MSKPIAIPQRKVTKSRHYEPETSYWKILSALESKNFKQITDLVTKWSSDKEISTVLSYCQNDRKLYRSLVDYYWDRVKNTPLTLRTDEDFDCYEDLGYNFNNLSPLEYDWLMKNNYKNIISRLHSWSYEDDDLSIIRYSISNTSTPQSGKFHSNYSS